MVFEGILIQLKRMFAEREAEEFDFVFDLFVAPIFRWDG